MVSLCAVLVMVVSFFFLQVHWSATVWLASVPCTMAVSGGDLSQLSRRHGIKVDARSTHAVEEVAFAAGK